MCGRYYIPGDDQTEELRAIIDEISKHRMVPENLKIQGEIFPSDMVPVVANNRNRQPSAFAMQWGYHLLDGKLLINVRSETASEKALFRDGMQQRRCLLPAGHYYEWERIAKTKYAIQPAEKSFFYLAGIYRIEQNRHGLIL